MMLKRFLNKGMARLMAYSPVFSKILVASFKPMETDSVPWTPVTRTLEESTIALVTTAGVHHQHQPPFDMADSEGDPSFRIIDALTIAEDYTITHDYFDHRDADRDLNVVFPITRLAEMRDAGLIRAIADRHYSFMGHIDGSHVKTLINRSAPRVARMLKRDRVGAGGVV
jgi:D-proline reductase (dithiol) PrdB